MQLFFVSFLVRVHRKKEVVLCVGEGGRERERRYGGMVAVWLTGREDSENKRKHKDRVYIEGFSCHSASPS